MAFQAAFFSPDGDCAELDSFVIIHLPISIGYVQAAEHPVQRDQFASKPISLKQSV
jgi:hypothetical protein